MRIIVTNKGVNNLKELEFLNRENTNKKEQQRSNSEAILRKKLISKEWVKYNETKHDKTLNKKGNQTLLYFEEGDIKPEFKNECKIISKKINIPKTMIEKYNDNGSFMRSMELETNNELTRRNDTEQNGNFFNGDLTLRKSNDGTSYENNKKFGTFNLENNPPKFKETIEMSNLIKPKVINDMFDNIKEYKYQRKVHELKVNQNKYREKIIEVNYKKDIKEKLTKKIPVDFIDTISYLKSREKLSEHMINKFTSGNLNQEKYYNKICQRVLLNNSRNEIEKVKIRNKINKENNSVKEQILKCINKMDEISNHEEVIYENYPDIKNHKKPMEIIKDKLENFKKSWKVHDINRFFKKYSNKNNLNLNNTFNIQFSNLPKIDGNI